MSRVLLLFPLVIVVLGIEPRCSRSAEPVPPNSLRLLADDMGWHDASCFGSAATPTPNIDAVAADGMKWTQFYAASAVCTPTRVSVLTGRYPLRFDVRRHFNDGDACLPTSAMTLGELLRDAGYATAHIGKWHLGGLQVDEEANE